MQSELEQRLRQEYFYVKNKTKAEIENATIEEQMAYELFSLKNLSNKPYFSVLDKMSQKIVRDKVYIKKEKTRLYKNQLLTEAGYFLIIGILEIMINIMRFIEKTSINYLEKTRPDVASMMKKGKPFNEIAKQYFKVNN
ncbi:MAG: hypothetical protein QW404_00015 [Candidatus Nanoarchaeia archaeon]